MIGFWMEKNMNLLIVDDEELTREGLLASIDWTSLGVHNIYQADDGINGLSLARKYKPQIILSDVRMPRMSGIEMAGKIREDLPDCHIIFMSGYSDKEYLKAAIRLKAISYVEKPILPQEVEDAVREAISSDAIQKLNKDSATRQIRETATKLALDITYAKVDDTAILDKQFAALHMHIKQTTSFTTIIVRFVEGFASIGSNAQEEILDYFKILMAPFHLQFIWAVKQDEYLICHVFSSGKPAGMPSMTKIFLNLAEKLSNSCHFYIAAGKTVTGVDKVFDSYNSAVILLASSFFYEYNSILLYQKEYHESQQISPDIISNFHEALSSRDKTETLRIVLSLYSKLMNNQGFLVNYVKDFYYKLFMELYKTASHLQIYLSDTDGSSETILDYISKSGTLTILNNLLTEKVNLLFRFLETNVQENSTIFLIKAFISKNFQNVNLSVKDISEHVYLSTSYVCTIFKNETGKTLNQYLTEYRYKITDISDKVGYSDGNYFGKTFKKMVGLSPSEFREQNAK
jgi:two-component system, response regulator YesN